MTTGASAGEGTACVDIFVGRQAIFDTRLNVYGYELLFRDGKENRAQFLDSDLATAKVFSTTFLELGPAIVTEGRLAFINVTRPIIMEDLAHLFPPEKVVLELLEDITVDQTLLTRVRKLKQAGYRIALDDFVFDGPSERLISLADIVKIDIRAWQTEKIRQQIPILKKRNVQLLAEKIETYEELALFQELGCDYFQGYFLGRPQIIKGRRSPVDKSGLIQLLAKVNNPSTDMNELVEIIRRDASLSYKLIKYINSAFFSFAAKIESVKHALNLLGKPMFRAWINLILFTGVIGKPNELLATAMFRARFCELLGLAVGTKHPDQFFTAGLFSTLDAILDKPMAEILDSLPILDELKAALTAHEGRLGAAIACTLAYERGNWEKISFPGLSGPKIQSAYLETTCWVVGIKENGKSSPTAQEKP